ncbi:ADAM 17-like protease [Pomacea canaliculata]|uniref:ADAM 17-like protease n=1 Tax=Pomacea canaliculata TaxID=400727 RepID=UPI000D739512|nr:ADAM 17-like protease [Pomacea canaliculata]
MQFCLAHLFTTTLFKDYNNRFGLAYLGNTGRSGGICAGRSGDMYRRTGWTTSKYGKGWILVGLRHRITTIHELGHNWGAPHDPPGECSPNDQEGGRYVMFANVVPGTHPNNWRFSPCSIDYISPVLRSVSQECFIESDKDEIPCGNGVVDFLEECDAGPDGLEGKDKCCSSICLLRENANCSDFNSQCCRNCTTAPAGTKCKRDPDNQCIESSKCDGSGLLCPHSVPVPDGTACQDSRVCFEGKCLSSCEVLEKKNGRTYNQCQCQDDINACKHCCQEVLGNENKCLPTVTSLGFREPCYKGCMQ